MASPGAWRQDRRAKLLHGSDDWDTRGVAFEALMDQEWRDTLASPPRSQK